MRRIMPLLVITVVAASFASCQGRGRRNLAVKPKPKQLSSLATQEYSARFGLSLSGGAKPVTSAELSNLVCEGAERTTHKSYDKSDERSGSLTVSFYAEPGLKTLSCSELGVRSDAQEFYTGTFALTGQPDAEGTFIFGNVALNLSQAGDGTGDGLDKKPGTDKEPGSNNPETAVKVDGTIKECPAGQAFDAKTGKCA